MYHILSEVVTETYRHFGRLGLGAVFGSKLLKGIVVSGVRSLPVSDPRLYRKTYDEIFKATTESTLFKKYHELGTAVNVLPLDALGALPTRNLQAATMKVQRISLASAWPKNTWAAAWPAPIVRWRASTSRRCASRTPISPTSTRRI